MTRTRPPRAPSGPARHRKSTEATGRSDTRPGSAASSSYKAASPQRAGANGLEVFQALAAGERPAPPLVRLLGFRLTEAAKGRVVFVATPTEAHYNGMGVVHGGWSAALLDSALGSAVNSMMPAGRVFATLELKVNLTRPLRAETGEVRCEATVLHVGRRTATADARVIDGQGRLYAHATATCIVVEPPR